jgi:hypothetical protein
MKKELWETFESPINREILIFLEGFLKKLNNLARQRGFNLKINPHCQIRAVQDLKEEEIEDAFVQALVFFISKKDLERSWSYRPVRDGRTEIYNKDIFVVLKVRDNQLDIISMGKRFKRIGLKKSKYFGLSKEEFELLSNEDKLALYKKKYNKGKRIKDEDDF